MESLDSVRRILTEADVAADSYRTMKEVNSYAFYSYNMPVCPAAVIPVNPFVILPLDMTLLKRTFSHTEHKKLRREKLSLYEAVVARQKAVLKLLKEGGDAERMYYMRILNNCLQEAVIKLQ